MCWWNVKHMKNFQDLTPEGFEHGTKSVSIGLMFFCALDNKSEVVCWKISKIGTNPFSDKTILEDGLKVK